jgi:tRNA threonylcarbamoyladenosine biosynthesis protein TsaB
MSNEPLILSIETATLAGAVAVSNGGKIIGSLEGDNSSSHSNTLLREIDTVLRRANRTLTEIDFFAVATGPGSFTGLRIGIATIKGLAFTLDRPCVAIPTLEAIAHSAGECARVVAALPAGRGEVFVQMFSVSAAEVVALDEPVHISPTAMLERYSDETNICWVGNGSIVHRDRIKTWAEDSGRRLIEVDHFDSQAGWRLVQGPANLAEHVAVLAWHRINKSEVVDANDLRAIYVRPSDAELKTGSVG